MPIFFDLLSEHLTDIYAEMSMGLLEFSNQNAQLLAMQRLQAEYSDDEIRVMQKDAEKVKGPLPRKSILEIHQDILQYDQEIYIPWIKKRFKKISKKDKEILREIRKEYLQIVKDSLQKKRNNPKLTKEQIQLLELQEKIYTSMPSYRIVGLKSYKDKSLPIFRLVEKYKSNFINKDGSRKYASILKKRYKLHFGKIGNLIGMLTSIPEGNIEDLIDLEIVDMLLIEQ